MRQGTTFRCSYEEDIYYQHRNLPTIQSSGTNNFVKFHGKKIWEPQHDCVISESML